MSLNKSEHENHRIPQDAQIAQLVEQRTENPRVAGSIPALGIFLFFRYALEKAAPEGAASFIL